MQIASRARVQSLCLVVAAALLCVPQVASAQLFRGVVLDDSTRLPLQQVSLALVLADGREQSMAAVRSDSVGRFAIHSPVSGAFRIRATRIGYSPLMSEVVTVGGGDGVFLTLAMSAVSQRLGSVVVVERRKLNGDELLSDMGFLLRRSKGSGRFLDSTELAALKSHNVRELIRDVGGRNIQLTVPDPCKSRGGGTRVVRDVFECVRAYDTLVMTSGLDSVGNPRTCAPELWVDGIQHPTINRVRSLRADEVYGLEMYTALQLPPPSIAGSLGGLQSLQPRTLRCGIIAVWTWSHVNELRKREKR